MKPKILFYDIETSPNLAYVWGKYEQNVIAYETEREMLSFAYSWLGSDEVVCMTREGLPSDVTIVKALSSLINSADVIVAHNGDKFDRKFLKTRMIYWKLRPLAINCSVDTLKVAKTYFSFNGNSLNDLCVHLEIGKKVATPGFEMWKGCLTNDKKSWALMAKYNKKDVVLLKKLYERFLPWIENHPNLKKLMNPYDREAGCPTCFSKALAKQGIRPTARGAMQRWGCTSCGKVFTALVEKEKK